MEDFADLKARYDRLHLLYQVGRTVHSSLEPQEVMQLILREAVRLMRASSGSAVLINPTTGLLEIHAAHGLPPNATELKLRVGEGLTGWVARTGKPARVGDVANDPRYVMLRPEVRSELAVPLEVNGDLRGVLNVDSDRADAFSAEDQELLEALAAEAARSIHHTWLYEQLRLKAKLFESLAEVSRGINSTFDLDDVLNVITKEACVLMHGKMCALRLLDETGAWLDLRASYGAGAGYLGKPRLSIEDSLLGVVVRRRKPLQVENVQVSSRYQAADIARDEGLVALLSVPLLYGGNAIGALSIYTGQAYNFSNEEVKILSALAELSAIAIQKTRLYERTADAEELLRQNEKLSALGLLAAEVAHEIRNPLTVMKMLYHSLDLQFPPNDPRHRDAQMLGEKMDQLNRIVERILDFARTPSPQLVRVDLNRILDELGLLVRHKLKHQNVKWICRPEAGLPTIAGDAAQLEQAFLNLILNAAEAMPNGGTITLTSGKVFAPENSPSPTHVMVEFTDTGQGMSPEQQRSAFTSMLNTTKPQGTGLGLAIVRRVVETHHGELKLKSRRGHGTTVTVLLPV